MRTNTWTFADTAKALELAFPWLAVEPESDDWDEPSGADVIDQLQEFYDNLLEGDRERRHSESGAVSLPLLTFQACAAVGLASALWSLYLRLAAQIGGLGL